MKTTLDVILEEKDPQIISDGLARVLGLQVLFDFFLHGRIPMVFDCVISAATQQLGYLGPFISQLYVAFNDDSILSFCPHLRFVDPGVQMIVPSFSALLSCASR
jgi:hypothetical protein